MTEHEDTLTAALYYAAQGYAVFPVHAALPPDGRCTCGNPTCGKLAGKHPATAHGLSEATTNPERIKAMWARAKHPLNVAIATGEKSGIWVLDIDGADGEVSLEDLAVRNGTLLPMTLEARTGSGRHLIFRHPGKKVMSRASKLGHKLDVRGDGGYIVAPPSIHRTGVYYSWEVETTPVAAPDWLVERVTAPILDRVPMADLPHPSNRETEWSTQEVREMLACLDPDMAYDDWCQIGMALHSGGYAWSLWDEWSQRGEKYQRGDCARRWNGFDSTGAVTMGTLVDAAKRNGWTRQEATELPAWIDVFRDNAKRKYFDSLPKPKPELEVLAKQIDQIRPSGILTPPPGLIADTVTWLTETAQLRQPELALLNTVAALGAVFGRRYKSEMNTRTNLYTIGVAATGGGKDYSRQMIKNLLLHAGLEEFRGSDTIKSAAGMVKSLSKRPSQILHIDEYGLFLKAVCDQHAPPYYKAISKAMMMLYSSSSSSYGGGEGASDEDKEIFINYPNLCIYGTTTPETFSAALTKQAVTSGELNRFIVIASKEAIPQRNHDATGAMASDTLIADWRALKAITPGNGNLTTVNSPNIDPDPMIVRNGECTKRLRDMADYQDNQVRSKGPLWVRYRENSIKIAMIAAIARNQITPVLMLPDLDFGEALVRKSIEYISLVAERDVADSDHERDCQEIMKLLREHGDMTKYNLTRATRRMDRKQRDAALSSLQEQGEVVFEQIKGATKNTVMVRLAQHSVM